MRRVATFTCFGIAWSVASVGAMPGTNPLERARVGQWVIERTRALDAETLVLRWVAAIEGRRVTLRTQVLEAGQATAATPALETTVDLDAAPENPRQGDDAAPTSEETLEVQGRPVACRRFEFERGAVFSSVWLSEVVPISGMVRSQTFQDGELLASIEVVDFGDEGGADRPFGSDTGGVLDMVQARDGEPSPDGDAAFPIGRPVAARWVNPKSGLASYYTARVVAVVGDDFAVEYGDGEVGRVPRDGLRQLVESSQLAVGDRVLAVWGGTPRLWPGEVLDLSADQLVVKWDDGSPPSPVPSGQACRE